MEPWRGRTGFPMSSFANSRWGGTLAGLAQTDPQKALSLANTMMVADAQPEARNWIASSWSIKEPAAAAAWVAETPNIEDKSQLVRGITERWANKDSTATAAWLEKLPAGETRDAAVASFSKAVVSADPAGAVAWAVTISDPTQRDQTLQLRVGEWQRIDKAAASAWLEKTTTISDAVRENLRNRKR